MSIRLFIVVTAMSISSTAVAQDNLEFDIKEKLKTDSPFTIEGQVLDILGISVGMSPDKIQDTMSQRDYTLEEKVTKNYINMKIPAELMRNIKGNTNYLQILSFLKKENTQTDTVKVQFSNGASGNKSKKIERKIIYNKNEAPNPETILQAMTKKYGEPTYFDQQELEACWTFTKQRKITKVNCRISDYFQIKAKIETDGIPAVAVLITMTSDQEIEVDENSDEAIEKNLREFIVRVENSIEDEKSKKAKAPDF